MRPVLLLLLALLSAAAPLRAQTTGLWLGSVTLDKVAEIPDGAGGVPSATPAPLNLTILLHVATSGQVTLLKEAWLMKTTGASTNNVIVTNPALLSAYQGIIDRQGQLVGARYSTAFFPYSGAAPLVSGTFAASQTLTATLALPAADPLNPYRHKYHPDHANGIPITRALTLTLSAPQPGDPPGTGIDRFNGTYAETVTGLHKLPLKTSGAITLTRLSTVGTLTN